MTNFTGNITSLGSRIVYDVSFLAGVQFYLDVRGTATGGGTLADPILRLYSGTTLLTSDDDGGVGFDSRIVYTFPTTGVYRLEVGESGDNAIGTYTLQINADDFRNTVDGSGATGVLPPGPTGNHGNINYGGDIDLFRVGLTAGVQYIIDLEGVATKQGTLSDPTIGAIYDPAGTVVAGKSDDDGGVGANARLVFTPTTTGSFYVAANAFGTGTGTYRITVNADDFRGTAEGTGPTGALAVASGLGGKVDYLGDHDLFSVTLTAGTRYLIDVEGTPTGQGTLADPTLYAILNTAGTAVATPTGAEQDGGVGANARLVFTPATTATYLLDVGGNGTGTYTVFARADDVRSTFEGTDAAGALALGDKGATGSVDYAGDVDIFLATLTGGTQYILDLEGAATKQGTLADPIITAIYDPAGTVLAGKSDDDGGIERNSRLAFTPATTGSYAIAARAFANNTGTYRLSIHEDDFRNTVEGSGTAAAGSLAVGTAGATGTINYGTDVDMFAVTLTAGTRYFFDLEGSATGIGTLADPFLVGIYDAAGTLLPNTANDDGGIDFDARSVFTPATSGTYYVAAASVNGNTGSYHLLARPDDATDILGTVGGTGNMLPGVLPFKGTIDYDGDRDLVAVPLQAGQQYYIDLQGAATIPGATLADPSIYGIFNDKGAKLGSTEDTDSGVGADARVLFTPATGGTYYIGAAGAAGNTGSFQLFVRRDDYRSTPEGSGALGTLAVGSPATAELQYAGDTDLFLMKVTAGTTYTIDMEGTPTGAGTLGNPRISAVYDTLGNLIPGMGDDDGGVGANARLIFTATGTGNYVIAAAGFDTFTGTYRLTARVDDFRDTVEGNGVAGTLPVGPIGATGTIETAGDRDMFAVSLLAGTRYFFDLEAPNKGGGTLAAASIKGIYDGAGTLQPGTTDESLGGPGNSARVVFTPTADGTYFVSAAADEAETGTYSLLARVDDFRDTLDTVGPLGSAAVGSTGATGTINYSGDRDIIRVPLVGGTTYFVDLEGSATKQGTLTNPLLAGILDPLGNAVANATDDDSGVGLNAGLVFTPTTSGTYSFIAGGTGGSTGSYRLLVRPDDLRTAVGGTGTPGVLTLGNIAATGTVNYAGDVDLFSVDLVGGTRYAFDLEGTATANGTLSDPFLAGLYDPAGTLLVGTADNDGGVGNNARVIFTAPSTGTYQVAARGFGLVTGSYRLFGRADDFKSTFEGNGVVGAVPLGATGATGTLENAADVDYFSVGLVAGTQYYVDLEGSDTKQGTLVDPRILSIANAAGALQFGTQDDDGGVGANARTIFTPSTTGTYFIAARGFFGATGTYRLRVAPDDWRSTLEGNGIAPTITPGATGQGGTINFKGDVDLFTVTLAAGTQYFIDLEGAATGKGSLGDPLLAGVYAPDGSLLPSSTDDDGGVGDNSRLILTPTASGVYTIAAAAVGAWIGTYQVFVRPDDFRSTFQGLGTAGALTLGITGATGTIDYAGDQDMFTVSLQAGRQYIIDLEGVATSKGTLNDPFLRGIYNAAGTLLASSTDDDGGVGVNARVAFTPTANGVYTIAAGAVGGGTGTYRLRAVADDFRSTVEGTGPAGSIALGGAGTSGSIEFAGDRDIFTVSLVAGTKYTIDMEGAPTGQGTIGDAYLASIIDPAGNQIATDNDGGVGANARVVFTAATTGTYSIAAAGWGSWTGSYRVFARADDFRSTYEGVGVAGAGVVGGTAAATINYAGDQDVFTAAFTANHLYRIQVQGSDSGNGTLADPFLRAVYNPSGTLLANATNDDANGLLDSSYNLLAYSTGTYSILAGAYGGATGTYKLRITDLSGPDLAANIGTTGTIAVGGSVRGLTESAGEADWYRTTLVGGVAYVIEEISIPDSANPVDDPLIRGIYTAAGTLVANTGNDDWAGGHDARVAFTPATTGTYYISAAAFGTNTGEYRLSLDTSDVSDLVTDTIAGAATLAVGTPATGTIDYSRDRDWFAVTFKVGTTYRIREQGAPSGNGSLADPTIIGIYDSTGTIVPGSGNDDDGMSRESSTLFSPSVTGTYYISAAAYGDYVGTYRLLVDVDSSGDVPASSWTSATVAVGGTYLGSIGGNGDHDWIKFTAAANTTYTVKVTGLGTGGLTLADPVLGGVFTASGQTVQMSGNDDFGGSRNAQFTFTAPTAGSYYIDAAGWGGAGSYQVSLSKATDSSAPALVFTSPSDNATGVPVGRNITLDFNEPVRAGVGNFLLAGSGGDVVLIPATSSQVTFNGEIVTINPSADLLPSSAYSVLMDKGAVTDLAGNQAAAITDTAKFNFTTSAPIGADSWTLMVYIAADNNLEGAAINDINEMERANLPANVNVMVMIDRAPGYDSSNGNWTDTRRGKITHDANNSNTIVSSLTSIGEQDTGKASTLTNFINWAASTAPATNYGLILWDHGGGISGSAWDDTNSGNNLSLLETRQAIAASTVTHFGMIGFDECLMAVTEQTMDLRTRADIIVSSQELEPGDGWEYDKFLPMLAANPGMSPMDLGAAIVKTYGERYAGEDNTTMSAVWTQWLGPLDTALESFCTAALAPATTAADWTAMREAASRSHHFGGDSRNLVDLRDFMLEVTGRVLSPSLKGAADAVANAVRTAVVASSGTVADAAGMSIYLPYGNTAVSGSYTPANFDFLNQVADWDNFLAKL